MSSVFLRNLNDMRYEKLRLRYNPADLTPEYYKKVKHITELEHQIGRLQNFKTIIEDIQKRNIPGDFIEFGVWQGFSLLWTGYFCQRSGLLDRRLIGVDGFIGLPNDDGDFKKAMFSNTSRKTCEHRLIASSDLYPDIKRQISIHESLFGEVDKMKRILSGKKFVFLHIDCDIGSAAIDLFKRFKENDSLADECFILFDDYGCVSTLKDVVDDEFKQLEKDWQITTHSETNLTKNFHLIRKKR